MTTLDKHYLSLQFKIRIYSKNGTEFQSFFENIMKKAFSDFRKVPSGGGDGGNDGWIKKLGSYYQVYAPNYPQTKDLDAARKLKNDFKTLKDNWGDKIQEIKEYSFVFNDNYFDSKKTHEIIVELEEENPNVKFRLLLADDLEKIFLSLDESDILELGFNIDQRQAISSAYEYLENVKTEFDRENVIYAKKNLENIKVIIKRLNDDNLFLEYNILECSYLQKTERIIEAKDTYESLTKRFPYDPRAFLYLSEIYLNDKNFGKNFELIQRAEVIDSDFWLLKFEKLLRRYYLEEKIDLDSIDENNFPSDPKVKSKFYCLFALLFEDENEHVKADSFIENAIHTNPAKLSNYIAKLTIFEKRLILKQESSKRQELARYLLQEIKDIEEKNIVYGDIGARNKAILNTKKLNALIILENYPEIEIILKEIFELTINCYLDKQVEQIITIVFRFIFLPYDIFNKLLEYIKDSNKEISDELSQVLISQFIKDGLLNDGKYFFEKINNKKYSDFITNLKDKNYEEVLTFLKNDIPFAVTIINTLKEFPELRMLIIEMLPEKENIQKEKLLLWHYFDHKDFDEAFRILKKINLTELSYFECKPILKIIQQKKAWDYAIIVLQKLLEKEKDEKQKFNFQLQLFNARFHLGEYNEVIQTGKSLLKSDAAKNLMDTRNKEKLLGNTILACFERGKIEKDRYQEAEKILLEFNLSEPSFEFKVEIEAEIYLHNNKPQEALNAVIEGVKTKKILSSQEYANLFFLLSIKIGKQIDLKLASLDGVKEKTFVKLKNNEQWYFIGEDNELDAIRINKTNNKYQIFKNKKLGEKIVFDSDYSSKKRDFSIEFIFPTEKYLLWKVVQNFRKLSNNDDLEGIWKIDVPQKGESIDTQNLLKMMEDMNKKSAPFFKKYQKNNVPLAMLAASEGGLVNAIGRIQSEQKGFINFSNGEIEDFEKQKEIARITIQKNKAFYIDGTSALFLSEIGYLEKIYKYIPNLNVPQSVISFLGEIIGMVAFTPGLAGHIGYSQGKIIYSSIDKEKSELLKRNIINSIKFLESNPDNVKVISSTNKANCNSEKIIPPELSDACILAQKNYNSVLTEDYLYLRMNEIETKKEAPKHFSSLALLKVLYEDKKISFNEYLKYFGYLSTYRFRFLSINSNDIESAVFGNKEIKIIKPENIKKFNFSLTLSEEYGVTFKNALNVVANFILKVLIDNSITAEITEKIFIEFLENFPINKSKCKKDIGYLLLRICHNEIRNNYSIFVLHTNDKTINEKFDKLLQVTEIYNSGSVIWTPEK